MQKGTVKDKMTAAEYRDYLARQEKAKNSKFKAIPTQTADGQKFKSLLEAHFYQRCWVRQRAGEITNIEREVRYELIVNGVFIAAYMMDFRLTLTDGTMEYIDCKSTATKTPLYLMKKALMLALYAIEITEIFE